VRQWGASRQRKWARRNGTSRHDVRRSGRRRRYHGVRLQKTNEAWKARTTGGTARSSPGLPERVASEERSENPGMGLGLTHEPKVVGMGTVHGSLAIISQEAGSREIVEVLDPGFL
jgi:hypothetical protein